MRPLTVCPDLELETVLCAPPAASRALHHLSDTKLPWSDLASLLSHSLFQSSSESAASSGGCSEPPLVTLFNQCFCA